MRSSSSRSSNVHYLTKSSTRSNAPSRRSLSNFSLKRDTEVKTIKTQSSVRVQNRKLCTKTATEDINTILAKRPERIKQKKLELPKPTHTIPLTTEFPGLPKYTSSRTAADWDSLRTPQITTLDNKCRVATVETAGQAASIAIIVDAGTIYEDASNHGVSHVIERMAFKGTEKMSAKELVQSFENLAGNVVSTSAREHMGYAADVVREQLPTALELLSDCLFRPLFLPEDVEEEKNFIANEIANTLPDQLLAETVLEVAYPEQPLARSIYPTDNVDNLTSDMVRAFHSKLYTPERMVVAAVGVDHDTVVKLAAKYFDRPAGNGPSRPLSKYIGGEHRIEQTEEEAARFETLTRTPAQSHIILAWEGCGLESEEMYPISVLSTLLGGGGSFSSGGPGKGMYSRLYRRVLNGNNYVENASSMLNSFVGTGLFGVSCTVVHGYLNKVIDLLMKELLAVCRNVTQEEFNRAKNQLKASIFMNLESRGVLADDVSRQLMFYGHYIPVSEICEKIDNLTIEDVLNLFKRILKSKPTMVVYGKEVEKVPPVDFIHQFLSDRLM